MNEAVSNKQRKHRLVPNRAAGFSPRERARSMAHRRADSNLQRITKTAARTAFALLLPLLTVSLTGGCDKPPPTAAIEIIDYVRSAVIRAEVRRLDAKPQAYVDEVMKHYHALVDACGPMRELTNSDEQWSLEDDAWRDPKKIAHRAEVIFGWFADDVLPRPESSSMDGDANVSDAVEQPVTRREHLGALMKAIDKVPEVFLEEQKTLASQVREELGIGPYGADAWYGLRAHAHRKLLVYLLQNAHRLDPATQGLTFLSNEVSNRARELWWVLAVQYESTEARLTRAASQIEESTALRDEHLQEKKELYALDNLDEKQVRRYRRLAVLFRFEDQRVKNAKATKKKLEAPGDDFAKSESSTGE